MGAGVSVGAGVSAGAASVPAGAASDRTVARAGTLVAKDVPSAWTSKPPDNSGEQALKKAAAGIPTCREYLAVRKSTDTATNAESRTFTDGANELSNEVWVFPNAAKAFLKWWFEDKQYGDWFHLQEGYFLQNSKKWASDPMWDKDPKMAPFREQPKYGRNQGYAGPGNEKASLAWSKFIVVDTFAKAVQSGDAAGSIAWGADELQRIYRD